MKATRTIENLPHQARWVLLFRPQTVREKRLRIEETIPPRWTSRLLARRTQNEELRSTFDTSDRSKLMTSSYPPDGAGSCSAQELESCPKTVTLRSDQRCRSVRIATRMSSRPPEGRFWTLTTHNGLTAPAALALFLGERNEVAQRGAYGPV